MDGDDLSLHLSPPRNGATISPSQATFVPSFSGWTWRLSALSGIWLTALLLSLFLADAVVSAWVHRNVPAAKLAGLFRVMKAPGHFGFTLALAVLVAILHRGRWRAAGFLCFCAMASGLLGALVKWGFGRIRPFHGSPVLELHPFINGIRGLFVSENLSFPSGHTCLAFATASALTVLAPRGWPAFYALAVVVAAERILEGSHYLGDVVAAAGLGVLSTLLVCWIYRLLSTHKLVRAGTSIQVDSGNEVE